LIGENIMQRNPETKSFSKEQDEFVAISYQESKKQGLALFWEGRKKLWLGFGGALIDIEEARRLLTICVDLSVNAIAPDLSTIYFYLSYCYLNLLQFKKAQDCINLSVSLQTNHSIQSVRYVADSDDVFAQREKKQLLTYLSSSPQVLRLDAVRLFNAPAVARESSCKDRFANSDVAVGLEDVAEAKLDQAMAKHLEQANLAFAQCEHLMIADMRSEQGNINKYLEETIKSCTLALKINMNCFDALLLLAKSYTLKGCRDLALQNFLYCLELIKSSPSYASKFYMLIMGLLHLNTRFEDILYLTLKGKMLDEKNYYSYCQLQADLELALGNVEIAASNYSKMINSFSAEKSSRNKSVQLSSLRKYYLLLHEWKKGEYGLLFRASIYLSCQPGRLWAACDCYIKVAQKDQEQAGNCYLQVASIYHGYLRGLLNKSDITRESCTQQNLDKIIDLTRYYYRLAYMYLSLDNNKSAERHQSTLMKLEELCLALHKKFAPNNISKKDFWGKSLSFFFSSAMRVNSVMVSSERFFARGSCTI
jgi:hypothetical protein